MLMRRIASFVLLFGLIVSVFANSTNVNAQEPISDIWDGPIQIEAVDTPTPTEVQNRPDCTYKNARKKKLNQPFEFLLGSIPVLNNLVYEDLGEQCVIQNNQGLFTSTYLKSLQFSTLASFYYGDKASGMFGFDIAGYNYLDPAPSGDVVMLQGRPTYFDQTYTATLLRNIADSTPIISGGQLVWGLNESDPERLLFSNGTEIRLSAHAFSSNGKYLVIQYNSVTAVINLDTMTLTPVMVDQYSSGAALAVSNDGAHVAVLKNGLHIVDAKNCQQTFAKGLWPTTFSNDLAGCTRIRDRLPEVKAAFYSNYFLRPYFSPNGSKIRLSAGTRIPGISPNATGPTAYTWQELEVTATNYVANVEGYIALGDSFSSGEGDTEGGTWYEPGTDEQGNKDTFEGRNLCHLSRRSYPYLIAKELGYLSGDPNTPTTPLDTGLFHSVACSGAVIHNIIGTKQKIFNPDISENQYRNDYLGDLGRWQPGRIKQLDTLELSVFGGYSISETMPAIITVGISGNDAGFGDTIKACTRPGTCKQAISGSVDASNLAIRLMKLKPKLVDLYKKTKAASPDSKVYVHGYPIFVQGTGGTCNLNVFLDSNETNMVEEGIKYMNQIVKAAAQEAGVFYIDVEDILSGSNLCSGKVARDTLVNGVTLGNDIDFTLCIFRSGCLGKESFHPNQKSQPLYKERILSVTNNFSELMPQPTTSITPIPNDFFGDMSKSEAQIINNGGNYTIEIPEPKNFMSTANNSFNVNQSGFLPGSNLIIEVQSTPIELQNLIVPADGIISSVISLPEELDSGLHEIHLKGTNKYGEAVDYYELIAKPVSLNDFDGDGINNETDSCPIQVNSLVDLDKDGTDDVCDNDVIPIVEPPIDPPPVVSWRSKVQALITKIISVLSKFFMSFRR